MAFALYNSINIASHGMSAQSERMKVISQNIANIDSAGQSPGSDPYRRKTISFAEEMDKLSGVKVVKIKKIGEDKGDFKMEYNPSHPAANEDGFVKMPNVESMLELVDMREAMRTYEANLSVVDTAKGMVASTINLLVK